MVSIKMIRKFSGYALPAFILCGIAILIAGCGGGGGGGNNGGETGDTTPPVVQVIHLEAPTNFNGGTVTFWASATDAGGIDEVRATITDPDDEDTVVLMHIDTNHNYTSTYNAPPNVTSSNQTYTVVIRATDDAGNHSSTSFTFQIPSPLQPPPPPPP